MTDVPLVLRLLTETDTKEVLEKDKKLLDDFTAKVKAARQDMLNQLSALNQSVLYTFQAVRLAARAAGIAITPIQSALMGVISGTTSLMLSMATAIAASSLGILGGVAIALAAAALTWQIAEATKLTLEFVMAQEKIQNVEQAIARLQEQTMMPRF